MLRQSLIKNNKHFGHSKILFTNLAKLSSFPIIKINGILAYLVSPLPSPSLLPGLNRGTYSALPAGGEAIDGERLEHEATPQPARRAGRQIGNKQEDKNTHPAREILARYEKSEQEKERVEAAS